MLGNYSNYLQMVVECLYQSFYRLLIELTNGRVTSGTLKKFSQSKWSRPFIPSYMKVYKINQDEIERDPASYATLHELFTRKLKKEARLISEGDLSVASPVDGVLEDTGEILPAKEIIVKGKVYSIEEMLGDDEVLEKYIGGTYLVLYLSPSHYHRIHAPVSGRVVRRWVLGRKSYPVNRYGMKYGKAPLSKNYRSITELKHASGHTAVVKVGAMFVNSIEITDPSQELKKGQEFAYFSFGSTVVLLFEKGTFQLGSAGCPQEVRVGQELGLLSARARQ